MGKQKLATDIIRLSSFKTIYMKLITSYRRHEDTTKSFQERSQDLNRPFQESSNILMFASSLRHWLHHCDADVIIVTPGKGMKNFKYCAISLNMVHAGGLCGVLGFTAPLISISKKFQNKYIYTLDSALCAPIARAAIKQLLLGVW